MFNVTSAQTFVVTQATKESELDLTVIDLTSHAKHVRNPENVGVWQFALLNRPELLTLKAKLRIMDNLLNQRHPLTNMGRVPQAAIDAYRADKAAKALRSL